MSLFSNYEMVATSQPSGGGILLFLRMNTVEENASELQFGADFLPGQDGPIYLMNDEALSVLDQLQEQNKKKGVPSTE
jgi:hypothetical protein